MKDRIAVLDVSLVKHGLVEVIEPVLVRHGSLLVGGVLRVVSPGDFFTGAGDKKQD